VDTKDLQKAFNFNNRIGNTKNSLEVKISLNHGLSFGMIYHQINGRKPGFDQHLIPKKWGCLLVKLLLMRE